MSLARNIGFCLCLAMKRLLFSILLILFPQAVFAADQPGNFDYYVLAVTWLPSFCQGRSEQVCAKNTNHFVVHGLWPQRENGWPEFCASASNHSDLRGIEKAQDLFSSKHAAFHEWYKHGTCSGLDLAAYFDLTRKAYSGLNFTETTALLNKKSRLNWRYVKDTLKKDNPGLPDDAIYVSIKKGTVDEVRICLTKSMQPRACSRSR